MPTIESEIETDVIMKPRFSVCEALKLARDKIKDPKNWNKNNPAQDTDGKQIEPFSDKACSWCALGAVRAIFPIGVIDLYGLRMETYTDFCTFQTAKQLLDTHTSHYDITFFNDHHDTTHGDVLALFDKAIAASKPEAAGALKCQ